MKRLEKRSSESVKFDIDCSALLGATEAITTITSIAADTNSGGALVFGTGVVNTVPITYYDSQGNARIAPTGSVVQVQISAGTLPTGIGSLDYVIRCKVTTNLNPAIEAVVVLRLNDTPTAV